MSLKTGLRAFLLLDAALVPLVACNIAGQPVVGVFSKVAPQGTAGDYITYQRIASRPFGHLGGGARSFSDLVQVNVYAFQRGDTATSPEARCEAITEAVRRRLDGYRGPMGDTTVLACLMRDERDDHEDQQDASEDVTCWTSQDFEILHIRG